MEIQKRKLLRRGKLATVLHIPWPTVKYYYEVGLFPVAGTTPNGQNLFDLEDIRKKYSVISQMKKKRFSIQEIKNRLIAESL